MISLISTDAVCSMCYGGRGREEGATPLYKPFRYMPPPKGKVFAPFWSENG